MDTPDEDTLYLCHWCERLVDPQGMAIRDPDVVYEMRCLVNAPVIYLEGIDCCHGTEEQA